MAIRFLLVELALCFFSAIPNSSSKSNNCRKHSKNINNSKLVDYLYIQLLYYYSAYFMHLMDVFDKLWIQKGILLLNPRVETLPIELELKPVKLK